MDRLRKLSIIALMRNQNHQLNWWYAPALKGHITGCVSRRIEKNCQPHNFHRLPLKRPVFYALGFLLPVNGSIGSLNDN